MYKKILIVLCLLILGGCSAFPQRYQTYISDQSPFILVIYSTSSWAGSINNISVAGQSGRHIFYLKEDSCWRIRKVSDEGTLKILVTTLDFEVIEDPIEIEPKETSEPYDVLFGCFYLKK